MDVRFATSPAVAGDDLNRLFAASWPSHEYVDFGPILTRSLAYVCAFVGERLIGFVNVAWDGGEHAFLLDPTVDPEFRRRGIGTGLVERATAAARAHGARWLHVDFETKLSEFYRRCGFRSTPAGLMELSSDAG